MSDPQTLEAPPRSIAQLRTDGLAALQASRFDEAADIFSEWTKQAPLSPEASYYHGYALNLTGQWEEALTALDDALGFDPRHYATHLQKALALLGLKRLSPALQSVETAMRMGPGRIDALTAGASILLAMDRVTEAETIIAKALQAAPRDPDVLVTAAKVLTRLGRDEEAATLHANALAHSPGYPSSLAARALSLEKRGLHEQALELCDTARAIAPGNFDALNIAGMVLANMKRFTDAIQAYRGAVMVRPDSADTWCSLGVVSFEAKQWREADFAYYRALELKPDLLLAARNHAFTLVRLSRIGAAKAFQRAYDLEPEDAGILSGLRMNKALVCDWEGFVALRDQASIDLESDKGIADPFEGLTFFSDGARQLRCAKLAAEGQLAHLGAVPMEHTFVPGEKIRVGYLSPDFREHPVGQLIEPVLAAHDRSQFELIAFSSNKNDDCATQQRMREMFDEFHDIEELDNLDLAKKIASRDIEILIDLAGYTQDGRPYVMAWRPAPVQVNFLGYSGTQGVDHVDYIIGDPQLTPPEYEPYYAEKVARLPHSYMPNAPREMEEAPARAEYGLPEDGMVFCSFSSGFKITPEIFDSWMRILEACPGSVLWLPDREGFELNLPIEAEARGMDPKRLVFARTTRSRPEHFTRLQLADIMLDTFPYGAHTTASDGLWCAVPVITVAGESFASRVAKSLLHAVGLPELVRDNTEDYEQFAIALAHDPERLAAIKAKLVAARDTAPLFDVVRYTRNFEAALKEMSARWRRGEAPASFDVVEADR